MIKNRRKSKRSRIDFTELQSAINNNDLDMVKALLAASSDPNELSQGANWTTALHVAASNGNLQAIALLLDAGANPYLLDSRGRTAQSVALHHHHMEAINVIQDHINKVVLKNGPANDEDSVIEIEIGDIPGFNEEAFHRKCSQAIDHYSDGGDPCLLPRETRKDYRQRPTSATLRRSKTTGTNFHE